VLNRKIQSTREEQVMNVFRFGRTTLLLVVAMLAACLLVVVLDTQPAQATFPGPNGDILYVGPPDPTSGAHYNQIFMIPSTGGTPRQVTNIGHQEPSNPTISPDGKTIAYCATPGPGLNGEIYTIPATGGTPTSITNAEADGPYAGNCQPSFSPDGKTIMYTHYDEANGFGIYTIPSTGGTPTKVLGNVGYVVSPRLSPDGKTIAFSACVPLSETSQNCNLEIFTMPSTGRTPTQLTSNATDVNDEAIPSFSPDGKTIAYTGNGSVYTIPSTGGTPTQLTHDNACWRGLPVFSPDGNRIAYIGACDPSVYDNPEDRQVFTIPSTGGTPTQVTNAPGWTLSNYLDWGVATGCTITGTSADDVLTGTSGPDTICGGGGKDIIKGLEGNDTIKGEAGADRLYGGAGNDALEGGLGSDTVNFSTSGAAVSVSLSANTATGDGSDTLGGIENIVGSPGSDTLRGDAGNNRLDGGLGVDEIWAEDGADRLSGGGGRDTQRGGLGDDSVIGGAGADNLLGEGGDDIVNSRDSVAGNDSLDGGLHISGDTAITDATERSIIGFP
jgi:Tol biopolymer transport system component